MRVAVIGAGYVGLTTGATLAYLGHEVTLVEVDPGKLRALLQGEVPFYEPHLGQLLALVRDRVRFTDRYEEAVPRAEVVFLAVGTPSLPDGSPDLSQVQAAARLIGEHLGEGFTVVVNKSTVPVGSGNWVGALVEEAYRARNGKAPQGRYAVASNPEFLREGSALRDSLYPDRVVIGSADREALEVLYTLYRPILEQSFTPPPFLPRPEGMGAVPLVATDLASAELIKYAANAFLALKISFINEMALLAEKVGADILQVAKGIGLDPRIGPRFLGAGVGWGGSCFGKDTAALLSTGREYGLHLATVEAARRVNYGMRMIVVEKLMAELKVLKGRRVGLLGLAFKPHTDDLRDAPALTIAEELRRRGAFVRAHDPVALPSARRLYPDLAEYVEDPLALAEGVDALVLVTEWPEYGNLPWERIRARMRTPLLLDGRNVLDPKLLLSLGFRYLGIGWGGLRLGVGQGGLEAVLEEA